MADVSESDTDTCVQKGQPNHGVRRWRAEGPGGEEGVLHAADLQIVPESRGLRKRAVGEGEGRAGRGGVAMKKPDLNALLNFISSIWEDREQNILALDRINNWKSDYCSSSIALKRNASVAVLSRALPRGCACPRRRWCPYLPRASRVASAGLPLSHGPHKKGLFLK